MKRKEIQLKEEADLAKIETQTAEKYCDVGIQI